MKKDTQMLLLAAAAAYGIWWYKTKRAPAEAPLTVQPNIYAGNTDIYGPAQF